MWGKNLLFKLKKTTCFHYFKVKNDIVQIGDVSFNQYNGQNPELIPNPLFFHIPQHVLILHDLLRALKSGEKHFLLIGNQGTGKNKLADHLLNLLQKERESICMHKLKSRLARML